jgi:hypothetical protein
VNVRYVRWVQSVNATQLIATQLIATQLIVYWQVLQSPRSAVR